MKKIFVLFCVFIPGILLGQPSDQFHLKLSNSISVSRSGNEGYPTPWVGGLNGSEVNTLDLNFDGAEDLVMFDRTAQKIITFLQINKQYIYAPEYETRFPEAVYNWLLIRDFDSDGKKDIFTGHIFGISVYKNVSTATQVKWELFPFYDRSSISEVVLTEGLSGRINLQLQFDDLPSIGDADGDGDIDIFCMNYGGSGTIEFHKNFSMERYGIADSLDFELFDNWWGGVRECHCGEFVFNKEDCPVSPGRTKHAGGKSLLLIDGDGDAKMDMFMTEGECAHLYMLDNNGTVDAPDIQQAILFPQENNASFNYYPTAYHEDVDFDGVKDLVVTPNIYSKSDATIDLKESHWFYKNMGSNTAPDWDLQSTSFLQHSMLDIGDNAVPAFADEDGDGDYDLLISNNGNPSVIRLYRNIGSPFQPSFILADEDYLNLSMQEFTNMKIHIVDIDADGKEDLSFMANRLDETIAHVFFIRNTSSESLSLAGQPMEQLNFQIARPENISFVDVNNDGKKDILKGKSNGAVDYWINEGSLNFSLETAQYLGLGANVTSTNISFAETDFDLDGERDLILTDQSGKLRILPSYQNETDLSNVLTNVVFDSLNNFYSPNLGGRLWVATAPLYGNNLPVLFAGTTLGGVRVLQSFLGEGSDVVINLYPNPVNLQTQELSVFVSHPATLTILNMKGQQLRPAIQLASNGLQNVQLFDYATGLYILQFTIAEKIYIKRLVIY